MVNPHIGGPACGGSMTAIACPVGLNMGGGLVCCVATGTSTNDTAVIHPVHRRETTEIMTIFTYVRRVDMVATLARGSRAIMTTDAIARYAHMGISAGKGSETLVTILAHIRSLSMVLRLAWRCRSIVATDTIARHAHMGIGASKGCKPFVTVFTDI
jgi:hypothetical protein